MRCEQCGREMPKKQGIRETRSEAVGPAGRFGQKTRTVMILLCPACARRRGTMVRHVLGAVALLLGGMLVIALLSGLGR
jgi:hypothetical protein